MALSKFNLVLWKYSDATPVDKLHRHHRRARRIVKAFALSSVGMASSLATGLLSDFSQVDIVILFAFCLVWFVLVLPMLFSYPIMDEIERILERTGQPLPPELQMAHKPPTWVFGMWFWMLVAIGVPWLINKFTG